MTTVIVAVVSYIRSSCQEPKKQVRQSQSKDVQIVSDWKENCTRSIPPLHKTALFNSLQNSNDSNGQLLLLTSLILSVVFYPKDCYFILKSLSCLLKDHILLNYHPPPLLLSDLFLSLSIGHSSFSKIFRYSTAKAQSLGLSASPITHSLCKIIYIVVNTIYILIMPH